MKTNPQFLFCTILVYSLIIGCQKGNIEASVFKVQSDTFKDEIVIPAGDKPVEDMISSPQLSWENAPLNTAHFIIIMDDNNPAKPHAW